MIKVKKGNISYKIDDSQLTRFLRMGYRPVDSELKPVEEEVQVTLEVNEDVQVDESSEVDEELMEEAFVPKKRKNLYHMTKAELLDCAIELGVELQGDENTSQVRDLVKELL